MTDKDREVLEAALRKSHWQNTNTVLAFGDGWQAARAHYAPKLTEKEFTDELNAATIAKWRGGEMGTTMEWISYIKEVVAALRAAGVQFRDEPNPEPGASR